MTGKRDPLLMVLTAVYILLSHASRLKDSAISCTCTYSSCHDFQIDWTLHGTLHSIM